MAPAPGLLRRSRFLGEVPVRDDDPSPPSGGVSAGERDKFEQPPCAFGIVAQSLRALDRLGNIRDDAVAPAAHLVAEEAG
jgi:hypothetical protein